MNYCVIILINLKRIINMKIESIVFFIVMTGIWGLTTVFIILGLPFMIIDGLFGTNLQNILEKILSGGEIALIKIWFCGLPFAILTDMHKKY